MSSTLKDAALLLIGHGSTSNPGSSSPVFHHAAQLRQRALFAQVQEAFWKEEPGIRQALDRISSARVFIFPLFLSEGYFTEEAIPDELGLRAGVAAFPRIQRKGEQLLFYCSPIGSHPVMTDIVLSRAQQVLLKHPFPRPPKVSETALFLAGHGTERNANSRTVAEWHAERIRQLGVYPEVHTAFLEEDPRIETFASITSLGKMVVVPFFLSDGLHAAEDVPIRLGEPERIVHERLRLQQPVWRNPTEKKGKLIWYARSVGTDPQVTDIILQRVKEMEMSLPSAQ